MSPSRPYVIPLASRANEGDSFNFAPAFYRPAAQSNAPPFILVVDDDFEVRRLLASTLEADGYDVASASNTQEMDRLLSQHQFQLVLLDVMLPGEDGLSACARIARDNGPSVIILSALGEVGDRIYGLDRGAAHYLTKPCSASELLATIRAALRARHLGGQVECNRYLFSGWCMDVNAHELTDADGLLVTLTDGEFSLLRALVERPRRVLSRELILQAARGPDSDAFDRAIDTQISRIRRKLRTTGDELIRTIRNEGYLFVPSVTRA